jgi:hypothetical protein
MKRSLLAMLVLGFCAALSTADHVIQIRLSIKVITNPDTGADPAGLAGVDLVATVEGMNTLMEPFGRGYEFVVVDPIVRVGGAPQFARPSPSFYSNQGLVTSDITRADLHADAIANPALYAWNPSAINIYINDVSNRMLCDPPNSVIVLGDAVAHDSGILLHDIGHFFGLCNTQGCGCECCVNPGPCPSNAPGNDGISDTLTDSACWSRADIGSYNFGLPTSDWTPAQSRAVSEAMSNIMGFNGGEDGANCRRGTNSSQTFLSEGQLDVWCDIASTNRASVCDGRVLFVRLGATTIGRNGRSFNPYGLVAEGVGAAHPGDIVLINGAAYPERITINRHVTLRTPRGQTARIGQ